MEAGCQLVWQDVNFVSLCFFRSVDYPSQTETEHGQPAMRTARFSAPVCAILQRVGPGLCPRLKGHLQADLRKQLLELRENKQAGDARSMAAEETHTACDNCLSLSLSLGLSYLSC